ncbi:hypothetical protein, partial [Nereida ignava]|uniref:hypothetical protein n=1 Tax=Nereida ignava TaxID=282199 RepID=UPI003F6B630F
IVYGRSADKAAICSRSGCNRRKPLQALRQIFSGAANSSDRSFSQSKSAGLNPKSRHAELPKKKLKTISQQVFL